MKCYVAVALLAMFAVAFALEVPAEPKKIEEPANLEEPARDKRGVLLGASYTAPYAYAAYSSPYYTNYHYPYAYSGYRAYPYYYSGYVG